MQKAESVDWICCKRSWLLRILSWMLLASPGRVKAYEKGSVTPAKPICKAMSIGVVTKLKLNFYKAIYRVYNMNSQLKLNKTYSRGPHLVKKENINCLITKWYRKYHEQCSLERDNLRWTPLALMDWHLKKRGNDQGTIGCTPRTCTQVIYCVL